MCLVDTANGILMLMAYTWATVRPMEKLFYNFLVTALSAAVALVIGSLEVLQLCAQQAALKGSPWKEIRNVDMASIGFFIIITFAVTCALSVCCAKCCSNADIACDVDCMHYIALKQDHEEDVETRPGRGGGQESHSDSRGEILDSSVSASLHVER